MYKTKKKVEYGDDREEKTKAACQVDGCSEDGMQRIAMAEEVVRDGVRWKQMIHGSNP